jgi:hypothetical protein
MAVREIDESEFLNYRAVSGVVNQILNHKDARKLMLQARKLADPTAVIPEIDAAAPVQSELAEVRKLLAEDKAAREAEKAEREQQARINEFQRGWDRQKSSLRNAGWSDEGIASIESHAQERGIPDLEVAAAHWEKLHPPAEPAQPSSGSSWNFFDTPKDDDTFVKGMISSRGEDDNVLNAEISAALKDFRSQTNSRR